jgi:hypothetical protein
VADLWFMLYGQRQRCGALPRESTKNVSGGERNKPWYLGCLLDRMTKGNTYFKACHLPRPSTPVCAGPEIDRASGGAICDSSPDFLVMHTAIEELRT